MPAKRQKNPLSLAPLVGPSTYTVWTALVRELVPEGRTHRLAPLVAGLLQYAVAVVEQRPAAGPAEDAATQALTASLEGDDPDEGRARVLPLVERLFDDAGVEYRRTSSRGERYSIAEAAVEEFLHWYDMPWE